MLRSAKLFSNLKRPVPRRRAICTICGGILLLGAGGSAARGQTLSEPLTEEGPDAAGIGIVRAITGTGGLGQADPLPVMQTGMDIFNGDRARTDAESRAHLGFGSATEVFLGANSEVIIDTFVAQSGGVIYLDGSLLFDRADDSTDPEAEVLTTYGRIGVRGTRFFVAKDDTGLAVFVERGAVMVTGRDDAATIVALEAGQGTLLTEPGAPPTPASRWSEERIAAITRAVLGDDLR